jgi:predicted anti-sigma-YlaC factor YlaD
MTCIKDDIIQKYIDGECTPEDVAIVERHFSTCKKCLTRVENQKSFAATIKKAIYQLEQEAIEIPKFELQSKNTKNPILPAKKLYYIIAAACILLFILTITQKKEFKPNDEIRFEIGSIIDVDANRPVSKFPLVIHIIDVKGNISEYYIK